MGDEETSTRSELLVTAAVAFIARALVALFARDRFGPADDGIYYDTLARRLAHGLGYTWAWPDGVVTPVAHYPVGYPALLSLVYRALGEAPSSALVLHVVLGTLGAVCVHRVAAAGCSPRVARWVGLAAALHPALLSYIPAIMTEGVTAALLPIPFALAVLGRRHSSATLAVTMALLAGLALGGASLVRPQGLLLIPFVAWIAGARSGALRRAIVGGAVVLGTALAVGPWTARNQRELGRAVMVSANGGWNLLIGTDPAAHGGWRALEAPEECRTVWDEAAKDACFGAAARRRILAAPLAWLALVPAKLGATFDLGGSGPSYLSRSRPDLVPRAWVLAEGGVETVVERLAVAVALLGVGVGSGPRRRLRRGVAGLTGACLLTPWAWAAYVGLVVVLALLGRQRLEREPLLLAALGVVGSTVVTHAVFFGAGRYGLVAYGWVAGLAAGATEGDPTGRMNFWRLPRYQG